LSSDVTTGSKPGRFNARVLQAGITVLVIGLLILLSSRSVGGGVAGILLSGTLSWFAFELAQSVVRDIWRVRTRVEPHHTILGGCLTAIAACGAGGLLLFFGHQLVVGVILGVVASVVTHQTRLPTLAQVTGLDPTPDTAGGPSFSKLLPRSVAATVALLCMLAGIVFAGLGTVRGLEAYSQATDLRCAHPCGMVNGLWVQVLPNSQGDFVYRRDPATVGLQVRVWDDVAGDKLVSRAAFTLTYPPVTYEQSTSSQGCDAWPSRTLHLDDTTGTLTLCFAAPQSQIGDIDQLVLEWAPEGGKVPILLGKKARPDWGIAFSTEFSPSPSSRGR
jgi:hypothetical protein